jgi:hypothetical protein
MQAQVEQQEEGYLKGRSCRKLCLHPRSQFSRQSTVRNVKKSKDMN